MEWHDQGIVLGARAYGENGAIAHLFSEQHGRVAGYLRSITSKRIRSIMQPGRTVQFSWRARLSEQTGALQIDEEVRPVFLIDQPYPLIAMNAMVGLLDICLQDQLAFPELYGASRGLLELLSHNTHWQPAYIKWELGLLQSMGYGLDLHKCALGGDANDLAYISPKTGRAASREKGQQWHDQLFLLPRFLCDPNAPYKKNDIDNGLRLSGYFLHQRLLLPIQKDFPNARNNLQEKLAQ
ncbi:MAG: DNA repair protein RecO [Pseudomonadota bacterium]